MSYYECTTVFSVSVDICLSRCRNSMCLCMMPFWKHVCVGTRLSQCVNSEPSTTTSADWTLRPTPARSKMSFRWAVCTNKCFSTKIMLFFLCRLLLKMWTYHQYNSENFAQQNNVNEYVQRENCSFITQKYRPKTLLWIAYLRPFSLRRTWWDLISDFELSR